MKSAANPALAENSLVVRFLHPPDFLDARVEGFASPAGAAAVLRQIAAERERTGYARVLVDCTLVIGQLAPSDHELVGAQIAGYLGAARCAGVAPPGAPAGEITPGARRGGANYPGFASREEAIAWLRREAP